jgi:hypothetical protein
LATFGAYPLDLRPNRIAEVPAYYAYVNRIADGLGVELEPWIWGEPSER